jgi:hypothetical protein
VYGEGNSEFTGYPYPEATDISTLPRHDTAFIYDIVENTIHFRFRALTKVYKGVVTVPKPTEDPSEYITFD